MRGEAKPLPSAEDTAPELSEEEGVAAEETPEEERPAAKRTPARPPAPRPTFKISTFVYVFCGLLGLLMLVDTGTRNSLAGGLGTSPSTWFFGGSGPLYQAIGFHSNYLLVTMALAGAIEMLITSLAYNYTTDWVKAARVQKWSSAFRKVQMEAIRSGKKDRIAALKPHQERLTRLSGEISIAQFKGMAITYFLLILIYSWVGLVIGQANSVQATVNLGGALVNLNHFAINYGGGGIPWWFLIFSLYTVPVSLIFRRFLKNFSLRRTSEKGRLASATAPPRSGRSSV